MTTAIMRHQTSVAVSLRMMNEDFFWIERQLADPENIIAGLNILFGGLALAGKISRAVGRLAGVVADAQEAVEVGVKVAGIRFVSLRWGLFNV
jgi:hypothetical protein